MDAQAGRARARARTGARAGFIFWATPRPAGLLGGDGRPLVRRDFSAADATRPSTRPRRGVAASTHETRGRRRDPSVDATAPRRRRDLRQRRPQVVPERATCAGRLVADDLEFAFPSRGGNARGLHPSHGFAFLGPAAPLVRLHLDAYGRSCAADAAAPAAATCAADETGVARAVVFWWRLDYAADESPLSTAPALDVSAAPALAGGDSAESHWRVAAAALPAALAVAPGDAVDLSVAVRDSEVVVLSAARRSGGGE